MNRIFLLILSLLTGLIVVSQSSVTQINIPHGLYAFSFQEDNLGRIWIGLSNGDIDGELGYSEGSSFTILSGIDNVPSGSYHESIHLPDGSKIFLGAAVSKNGGLVLAHITSEKIDTIQIPFALPLPFVNCISIVNKSEIWIGTSSGLLVGKAGFWELLTQTNGLPSNVVTSVVQDLRGIIWVATERGVVSFLDGQLVQPKVGERLVSKATTLFVDYKGYVWAGSRFSAEGISVFNGKLWETFSGRHGLVDNTVSSFYSDAKGFLWVGSCPQRNRGGLSSFNGREWIAYEHPTSLAKPCVDAIITDKRGNIWIGGSLSTSKAKGISVFDGNNWFSLSNKANLKAERVIKFFVDSKGRIWISSFEGLFVLPPNFNFYQ